MQLLENIRNRIGTFLLHQHTNQKSPKRKFVSLNEARDIGIVYDATDINKEKTVHQYAERLRHEGKKVFLLGYADVKTLPANKKTSIQSEYFCKENLTLFNLPDKEKIGHFPEMNFDLLLNIYDKPHMPMLAISAYSKAKYRVGPGIPNGLLYFDGIIDTGKNKDLLFLIEQMDFYLKAIK